MLSARSGEAAFHPRSPQRVLDSDDRLLAIVRGPYTEETDGDEEAVTVLALHNVSSESVEFRDRRDKYPWSDDGVARDLITGDLVVPTSEGALFSLELEPYEVMWLRF